MPVVRHKVSFRNGPQVMVAGLKLHALGYGRGASVTVSDPAGVSRNVPWSFMVDNDEHATLVSRSPMPPAWIQPGVVVQIEVNPATSSNRSDLDVATTMPIASLPSPVTASAPVPTAARQTVTASDLREWRGAIVSILNSLESKRPERGAEGFAARVSRLRREGVVPPEIANFMLAVAEFRNRAEYDERSLDAVESDAVSAAWRAVAQWHAGRSKA